MTRITLLAALMAMLLTASSIANARGGGASAFAPGHEFRAHGSVAGHPGASGYAPGAACSEHTVACGAIPALLVTLPDIDLYTTEVMQDQDDTGPPQLAASFVTGRAGRDRSPRWPPSMKRGGPANGTAR